MIPALLIGSILLSSGRNLLSKGISGNRFGGRRFFLCQALLFLFGALSLLLFGGIDRRLPHDSVLLLAPIYGVLLIGAQWCYTVALSGGGTGLCSTVYSMGFLLPTLSGALFWNEPFSPFDGLGVLCAILAVILSGQKSPCDRRSSQSRTFLLPLILAMLSSGGLGIVQKLQQSSPGAGDKSVFLLLAFLLAALISLAAIPFCAREETRMDPRTFLLSGGIGVCFGCCNLMNTALAGMLPSAIFFPTLNIGSILLTLLASVALFRERPGKREAAVLIAGAGAILLLNLF